MPESRRGIGRRELPGCGFKSIHHSEDVRESQCNLSNTFSWWDRLFKTYVDSPQTIPEKMTFGVAAFRDRKHLTLPWMLAQPFLRTTPAAPRNENAIALKL